MFRVATNYSSLAKLAPSRLGCTAQKWAISFPRCGPPPQLQQSRMLVMTTRTPPSGDNGTHTAVVGNLNNAFLNCRAKDFFAIHGGQLHKEQGKISLNFDVQPKESTFLDSVKTVSTFASLVDIPAELPWLKGGIEVFEGMQPLQYEMDSVMRKRARKMNKHKHRKKLKETRFLRRKLKKA